MRRIREDNEAQLLLLIGILLTITLLTMTLLTVRIVDTRHQTTLEAGSLTGEYDNVKEKFGEALEDNYNILYSPTTPVNVTATEAFNITLSQFKNIEALYALDFDAELLNVTQSDPTHVRLSVSFILQNPQGSISEELSYIISIRNP